MEKLAADFPAVRDYRAWLGRQYGQLGSLLSGSGRQADGARLLLRRPLFTGGSNFLRR